jgi:hypothetical protein
MNKSQWVVGLACTFNQMIMRQSPRFVKLQNLGAVELWASEAWLWQLFGGTALRLFLPTLWKLQLLLRVFFCVAFVSRMCCNQSSSTFLGSRRKQTLSYSASWSMVIACSRQRNDEPCRCSQLACCCRNNKGKAVPYWVPMDAGLVEMGSMPILCRMHTS